MSYLSATTQKVSPCPPTRLLVQSRNNQCEMWKVLMYVRILNKAFELEQLSSMSTVTLYLFYFKALTESHPDYMNTCKRSFICNRWPSQRLTAMVSPSPTVSMLRSMRSSKCSFLLRVSKTEEMTSAGSRLTTFPPHSTFKRNKDFTPSERPSTSACAASTNVIDGNDAALPNQLQGLLVVVVIVGFIGINEHKVVGSGLACCYQLI